MSVLIKVLGRSVVGALAAGLIGCGGLFPSTPSTLNSPNPYPDLYKAKDLQYRGKYRAAIAKYGQAAKKFPRFPDETKVIHVSFPAFLKYHIAFCYAKLAEAEGDVSLYVKAEAAVQESYQTAIVDADRADALYLWAYILFKQEHYEEARAKFEALLKRLQQNEDDDRFTAYILFGLGKALIGLGDTATAQRVFGQLEARIEILLPVHDRAEVLYALGNVYLELGDNAAAQRVFTQLEARIEADLQKFGYPFHSVDYYEETLFALGNVYLELGDEASARRVFMQLLEHYRDSSRKAEVKRLLEKQ